MTLDILVPYWGDPTLMRMTVESVLAQTSPDWRLVVVDDAYPDHAVTDWLRSLDDPRIRAERNETNLGITANYRRCRELATSELVMFLGCDDLLLPDYVEVVTTAVAGRPEADVVQPGVRVVGADGAMRGTLTDAVKRVVRRSAVRGAGTAELSGERLAVSLLHGDWLYWPSLTFRRTTLASVDFREGFPIIQDFALVIDLVCAGATLLVLPTECFVYRRHEESASATTLSDGSRLAAERRYYALAAEQMRALGWRQAERAARARLTSRAHALTLLPQAVVGRRRDAVGQLGRHALGR